MEKLNIEKIRVGFNNVNILNDISFSLSEKDFLFIGGSNGSGKSTLIRTLLGFCEFEGSIIWNGNSMIDNFLNLRKDIGYLSSDFSNLFINDLVLEEIIFPLENLGYSKDIIDERLNCILEKLDIKYLVGTEINKLTYDEKFLVSFARILMNEPKIIIFDEVLETVSFNVNSKIMDFIGKFRKNGGITILISHNSEYMMSSNKVLIVNCGKPVYFGSLKEVLKNDKILLDNGVKVPFIVELSDYLFDYGLIDKKVFTVKECVDKL